ncbi:MAG: hypothetical protein LBL63_03745 [Clostridiales Family XIII bacterium]|jgi:dipeptidase D|nr:hypothetical protein [Clostridiales Family XIII bacterium]
MNKIFDTGRRTALWVLVCVLSTTFILSSCDAGGGATAATVDADNVLRQYRDILFFPRSGEGYPEKINAYISERVTTMGYTAETDASGNVIVDVPASAGAEEQPLTILQCHTGDEIAVSKSRLFDAANDGVLIDAYREDGIIQGDDTSMGASGAVGVATILTVLQTSLRHGPIRAIFTCGQDGDMSGARNLAPEYPEGHCLISLDGNRLGTVGIGAAYALTLRGDLNFTGAATQGRHAYVLAASGFAGGRMTTNAGESRINPVTLITEALTKAKSQGIFYELCNFSAGSNALRMPEEATAVVVLNDYEEKKFIRTFDEGAREYRDRAGKDAEIAMIETAVPDEVMSNDESANALTFLFGLLSSDFSADQAISATLGIDRLDLSPHRFTCDISVLGADEEAVGKINDEKANIEKLSSIPLVETGRIPGFSTPEDSEAVRLLCKAYGHALGEDCKTGAEASVGELGYLKEKNPDLDIMSIGVTIDGRDTVNESFERNTLAIPANAILEYLTSESQKTR